MSHYTRPVDLQADNWQDVIDDLIAAAAELAQEPGALPDWLRHAAGKIEETLWERLHNPTATDFRFVVLQSMSIFSAAVNGASNHNPQVVEAVGRAQQAFSLAIFGPASIFWSVPAYQRRQQQEPTDD